MLTPSQKKAKNEIEYFLADPNDMCICLSGKPGTGKSYFIKEVIEPMVDTYHLNIALTATTNKAANVIGGETTFSHFGLRVVFNDKDGTYEIDDRKLKTIYDEVIIIDEASMLDYRLFNIITTSVVNCKFIFVGDMNQLPAVKGGINVFEKYPVVILTDVVRQKKQDLIDLIEEAKSNIKLAQVISTINPTANIEIIKDKEEMEEVIKSLTYRDKILAYTNDAVIAYNLWYRDLLHKPKELSVGDLVVSKSYCMSFEQPMCRLYAEQEEVITDISEPFELIFPTTNEGCGFMVKKVYLTNCDYAFYIPCNPKLHRSLLKQLASDKNWKDYYFLKEKIADLRDNLACTVHASQGSTYNSVLIDLRNIRTCKAMSVKTRLIYVALSRAKEKIYIYDKE